MSEKLIVNNRGTVTLPIKMRQHLGLKAGDVLEIEEKNGQMLLKPTISLPLRQYDDAEIKSWMVADAMTQEQCGRFDAWLKKADH